MIQLEGRVTFVSVGNPVMQKPLPNCFQIEDHIHQDSSGVIFRAIDTENGRSVALRRFFPFGVDGGGLIDDERKAYNTTIGRLARVHHPALRAVIGGSCDPVDGIPFIVTEWIEGEPLSVLLESAPLDAETAVELISCAIEVCELISRALNDEAVWVDVDLETIVRGDASSGRGFTFWISPLKWLGNNEAPRDLQPLVRLTEQVMGWEGQFVSDHSGGGLGLWFNWLRREANPTLGDARARLAIATQSMVPQTIVLTPKHEPTTIASKAPARKVLACNVSTLKPSPALLVTSHTPSQKSPKVALLSGLGVALLLICLIGWGLSTQQIRPNENNPEAPQATQVELTNQRAAELNEQTLQANRERDELLAAQTATMEKRGGVFSIHEGELLELEKGESVNFSGKIEKIESSQTGATVYLYFSQEPSETEPRAAILLSNVPDMDRASLDSYVGKEIKVSGKVVVERGRPQITIARRSDIELYATHH